MDIIPEGLTPKWPAHSGIKAWISTRLGGVSRAPYDTLNLAAHVGDCPNAVTRNRAKLQVLGCQPKWLNQVHGVDVVHWDKQTHFAQPPIADASWTQTQGLACAVLTADCLPILLCDIQGTVVGAAHAGWRGLAAGILDHLIMSMPANPHQLMAWLGPCIGPKAFEVGVEVRDFFLQKKFHGQENNPPEIEEAFSASSRAGYFYADLHSLAKQKLTQLGVIQIYGEPICTYHDTRFYSFRREPSTGRFVSMIWIEPTR